MRLAIWTVTRGAGKSGLEIIKKVKADLYTLRKFDIKDTIQIENFNDELKKEFNNYDGHIFIMATGIVIRKIAKLIKRKDIDPAVVVVDERLNFAISLLSGHIGGANNLVNELEKSCGLLPIITTSSDINGTLAVDTLAKNLKCELRSLEEAKNITSLIVDKQAVEIKFPKNIASNNNPKGVIVVSNAREIEITQIYPRNLIVGIGARRGVNSVDIIKLLTELLKKHNLSEKSIRYFATVDVKKDEKGILETAKNYGRLLKIISREEIKPIEHMFLGSEFVKKTIGVSSVSEPCAYLCSNQNGRFIEKKAKKNGITISIYEERGIYEKR